MVTGSMVSRYGLIYEKSPEDCFQLLYSGSENVGVSSVPNGLEHKNRIKNGYYYGYKLLRDSSWGQNMLSIQYYAYDSKTKQYRAIYTTTSPNWFF